MDAYTTINDMWEISQNTSYLLGNVYMGIGEFAGTGYHVDNVQMMQTVESQLMTSCGSCTKRSHKSIPQINCTNELHETITQDKMTSHPRMEMTNDAFGAAYGGPETG